MRVADGEPGVECQIAFVQMGLIVDLETGRKAAGARADLHRGRRYTDETGTVFRVFVTLGLSVSRVVLEPYF